ncbi:MAG: signal peptidase II [Candidatus Woesearchaeota archaeon]|nr:MAG: signal peptidase II [Candidatus Woesearchaeota archaeon]
MARQSKQKGMKFPGKVVLAFLLAVLVDQSTKFLFRNGLDVSFGVLHLHFVANTGVSWGLFPGKNLLFLGLSIIILGMCWLAFSQFDRRSWLGESLFFAGGVGNILDRIFFGFVTDFIDLGFFPVFNVADALLSVSIVLIILYEFSLQRKKKHP